MEYTLKVGDLIAQKQGKITGIYKVVRLTRTTAIIDMNGNEVKVKGEVNPNYFRRIGADAWSRESFKLATEADILKTCDEAVQYGFATVCIEARFLPVAVPRLKGSRVKPITVVSFPKGNSSTESKAAETKRAVEAGALEVDMVLNRDLLKRSCG